MNDFISIVILQFNNSHYTIALLNSLEKIKNKSNVIIENYSNHFLLKIVRM